eukprot:4786330-Pyramimonas_sp.AAC.1
MSQSKRAVPPFAQHLGAEGREGVSSDRRRTTSRAAARSAELRACLRRNGPGHFARDISGLKLRGCIQRDGWENFARGIQEPGLSRMYQAKRSGPFLARYLGA